MLSPPDYAPNPSIAYVWLSIGGTPVTDPDASGARPRHLVKFSFEQTVETLGKFEIVLFDPENDVIEDLVANAKGACQFKFGYTTGRQSDPYDGIIFEYVPEFLYNGIQITLRGMSKASDFQKQIVTRSWGPDLRISEIVGQIADKYGLAKDIAVTKKIFVRENGEKTDLEQKVWQQHSTDFSFIKDQLLPLAVREDDDVGGFVFYYNAKEKKLHFKPPDKESIEKTFIWRKKDTEVIRFSPHYNGNLLAAMFLGGAVHGPSIDIHNRETEEVEEKNKGVQATTKGTGEGQSTDPQADQKAKTESEEPFKTSGRVVKVWADKEMAENNAKFWWYRYSWMAAFQGDLVVVGDPLLKPWVRYRVQVEKSTGGLHWTSGVYYARGINHVIEGGQYQSTLLLWRTGEKSGQEATRQK